MPWLLAFAEVAPQWGINNERRQAHFMGQVAHESRELTVLEENLNYSAERLCAVWPKRFPTVDDARPYAHNAEALANRVYASRNGNGDEASGDGWLFRGRGPIQLTFRNNYSAAGAAIGQPLTDEPARLLIPHVGAAAACWFWRTHGLNELADADDLEGITRRVNGGLNGLDERRAYVDKAAHALTI